MFCNFVIEYHIIYDKTDSTSHIGTILSCAAVSKGT
jgi:hypothetical protein